MMFCKVKSVRGLCEQGLGSIKDVQIGNPWLVSSERKHSSLKLLLCNLLSFQVQPWRVMF